MSMNSKKPKQSAAVTVQDVKPKRDPFYTNPGSIDEFCEYIAAGGNLTGFQKARGLAYTTLADWVHDNPERKARYERARELRADVIFDEIVAISDETDVQASYNGEDVTLGLDATAVARNRLRVDARKWAAAKLKPKAYGDKVTQEHVGAGGGAIAIAAMDFKGLSDAELANMQQLMLKAAVK
jgi:hypothetical protein